MLDQLDNTDSENTPVEDADICVSEAGIGHTALGFFNGASKLAAAPFAFEALGLAGQERSDREVAKGLFPICLMPRRYPVGCTREKRRTLGCRSNGTVGN